jgi:hypothetical protein
VGQSQPDFNQQLCLGSRYERAAVHRKLQMPEAAPAHDVGDGLAPHRTAAHGVLEGTHRRPRDDKLSIDQQPLARDPERVREQHFRIQPGRFATRGPNRRDGPIERVARGGSTKRPARSGAHATPDFIPARLASGAHGGS